MPLIETSPRQQHPSLLSGKGGSGGGRAGALSAAPTRRRHSRDIAYRKTNQEKLRASSAAYRKANPEKVRAAAVAYRKANPEMARTNGAAWAKANPERTRARSAAWREANPEKSRFRVAAWAKANPERVQASSQRRRAHKASVENTLTTKEETLIRRTATHCSLCGMVLVLGGPVRLRPSLDHTIPISRGGGHTADNVTVAHHGCNSAKGARL